MPVKRSQGPIAPVPAVPKEIDRSKHTAALNFLTGISLEADHPSGPSSPASLHRHHPHHHRKHHHPHQMDALQQRRQHQHHHPRQHTRQHENAQAAQADEPSRTVSEASVESVGTQDSRQGTPPPPHKAHPAPTDDVAPVCGSQREDDVCKQRKGRKQVILRPHSRLRESFEETTSA